MTLDEIVEENARLRNAIRKHRGAKGHEACWLNDQELYAVLGEPMPDRKLPPEDEFLAECAVHCKNYYRGQKGAVTA